MTDHSQTQKCWGHWVPGSGCKKHFKLTRNNVQAIKSKTGLYMEHRHGYFHAHRNWLTEKDVAAKIGIHAD